MLTYTRIDHHQAKKMMEELSNYTIVDVRKFMEYKLGHIPGAMLLPLDELEYIAEEELPDKDQVLFVYCRSGVRSVAASEYLASLGYKNVYEFGGIIDWPYEIVEE